MTNRSQLLRNRPNQGGLIGMGCALCAFSLIWWIIAIVDITGGKSAGEAISYAVFGLLSGAVAVRVLTKSRTYVAADPAADAVIVRNTFRTHRIPWSQINRVEMDHGVRRRAWLHLSDGHRVAMDAFSSGVMLPGVAHPDQRAAVCGALQKRLDQHRAGGAASAGAPAGTRSPVGGKA